MNFEEFKKNVEQWASERGILQNGNAYTQTLKLISEFGELCDAIAKSDTTEVADAIGDCAVVLVIINKLNNHGDKAATIWQSTQQKDCLSDMLNALANMLTKPTTNLTYALELGLQDLATYNGLDFLACCEYAWNEIKDRKGFLNAQGVFIKEEN